MRTERQHKLDLAIAEYLANCGRFLAPDDTLRATVVACVYPPAKAHEITDSVRHLEAEGRIRCAHTETGRKWSFTDEGRAWHEAHTSR